MKGLRASNVFFFSPEVHIEMKSLFWVSKKILNLEEAKITCLQVLQVTWSELHILVSKLLFIFQVLILQEKERPEYFLILKMVIAKNENLRIVGNVS